MDIKSKEARSANMRLIKHKNTKPEIYFRKLLFSNGFRYRIAVNTIPGHPDIFLKKFNTAIFVHGCFWHRHENCKYSYMPKSRITFWEKKFSDNITRDRIVQNELAAQGVRQLIVWECTIRKMVKSPDFECEILNQCIEFLNSDQVFLIL